MDELSGKEVSGCGRETGIVSGRRTGGRRWRRDSPQTNLKATANATSLAAGRRVADQNHTTVAEAQDKLLVDANHRETSQKGFEATREQTNTSSRKPKLATNRKHHHKQTPLVLIHTEAMNTSSPILFVGPAKKASGQEQQLIGEGASPLPAWLEKGEASLHRQPPQRNPPKIVIHQLQVNSTSASLSWLLATPVADEPGQSTGGERGSTAEQMMNTRNALGGIPKNSPQQPLPHQQQFEQLPGDRGGLGGGGGNVRQKREVQDWEANFERRGRRVRYPGEESGPNNGAMNTEVDSEDHRKDLQTKGTKNNSDSLDNEASDKQQQQQQSGKLLDKSSTSSTEKLGGSSLAAQDYSNSRNLQSRVQQHKTSTSNESQAKHLHLATDLSSKSDTRRSEGRRRLTGGNRQHIGRSDELSVIKTASVPLNRLPQPAPPAATTASPDSSALLGGSGGSSSSGGRVGKSVSQSSHNHWLLSNTSTKQSILVDPTSSTPAVQHQQQLQESTTASPASPGSGVITGRPDTVELNNEAEWLVRLRRFGSEELDIVQIVARNLSRTFTGADQHQKEPQVRQIVFKDLLPETGYEICVESPQVSTADSSSNPQDIDDKYQILTSSQFSTLKYYNSKLNNTNSPEASSNNLTSVTPQRSLCREFFTLPANSNGTIVFGGGGVEESSVVDKQRLQSNSGAQVNETNAAIVRRPKSLNNVIRNRMELLEISDTQLGRSGDLNLFEVHVSHPRLENSRFLNNEQVISSSTEQSPTLRLAKSISEQPITSNNHEFISLSVLPIVGCIFGLIFIVTLANVILSAINCRSTTSRANNKKVKKGKRLNPNLGSFYSGSNVSGTSQSRMVVVGGKNSEPFAISSGYFEVPSAQHSSSASPTSNYLLARFPLGSSFDGDESHNADMVGLARKNYDNFIYNMYNSSQSANDLSSLRKQSAAARSPSSVEHISISGQKHRQQHHRREVEPPQVARDVQYSPRENLAEEHHSHRSSGLSGESSKGKQRVRYDKINPIYNMEQYSSPTSGVAGRARWPLGVSSFGHSNQALVEDNQYLSNTGGTDSAQDTSVDVEDCELCQKESSMGNFEEQPFTCCLDKQKQRFEKQQQQLGRVLTKNGSLVPQPYIYPIEPQTPDCQLPDSRQTSLEINTTSNMRRGSMESQLDKDDQEIQVINNKPTPHNTRHSSDKLVTTVAQQQVDETPLPPPPPPLPMELTKMPNSTPDEQAMKKSNFNQRRDELASKLYLNGMTKLNA